MKVVFENLASVIRYVVKMVATTLFVETGARSDPACGSGLDGGQLGGASFCCDWSKRWIASENCRYFKIQRPKDREQLHSRGRNGEKEDLTCTPFCPVRARYFAKYWDNCKRDGLIESSPVRCSPDPTNSWHAE